MGTLKDKVRNPAQPEDSIIQGIGGEEVSNFVADTSRIIAYCYDNIAALLHIRSNISRKNKKKNIK